MWSTSDFHAAIAAAGITPPTDLIADGKLHRYSSNGKRGDNAGWYVLHDHGQFAGGVFGDFRSGLTQTWKSGGTSTMTPAELAKLNEKIEAAKKLRDAEKQADQRAAAERAAVIWGAAEPCAEHQYLTEKAVASYGLRVGRWTKTDPETGEITLDVPDALLVPFFDGSKISSLQAIYPTKIGGRNKDFLKGGKQSGCSFLIGVVPANPDSQNRIFVVEGYATGATVHATTGMAVHVAFAAGNLKHVAKRVRAEYPRHDICIVADNDQWTLAPVENPGVVAAKEAAHAARAHIVIPDFTDFDLSKKPTDINDLQLLAGLDECKRQLLGLSDDADMEPDFYDDEPDDLPMAPEQKKDVARMPKTIDTISTLPDTNGKGKPLATIENLAEICRRLGVVVRYNVVSKEDEIIIPGASFTLDNAANASVAWLESWCARFSMPIGQLGGFICYIADQNQYNPVARWIKSKPWDGMSRAQAFFGTVGSDNPLLRDVLLRRWMISACAAAFRPSGVSAQGVLVFQGPQNLGKTKWFKGLAPTDLGVIQDGVILDPKDKDSVKQAVSNWLVELGEVDATFRKSDIAQLKAFLTRDKDVLRRAYAKKESSYPRRTVFFASVNPEYFLSDPTGNKRYWTIKCTHLDHSHSLDMQQVWAEFATLYESGESWYLTQDELDELNDSNEQHETHDPIIERIQTRLGWDEPPECWVWATVTDVLLKCGFDRPTNADVTRAGIYLRKDPRVQSKKSNGSRLLLTPKEKVW